MRDVACACATHVHMAPTCSGRFETQGHPGKQKRLGWSPACAAVAETSAHLHCHLCIISQLATARWYVPCILLGPSQHRTSTTKGRQPAYALICCKSTSLGKPPGSNYILWKQKHWRPHVAWMHFSQICTKGYNGTLHIQSAARKLPKYKE